MTPDDNSVSSAQIRAARALLGWNQQELASRANVGASTVADFERGRRLPVANNLEAIRSAIEREGITFLAGGAVTGPPQRSGTAALLAAGTPIRLVEATDLVQWAERLDSKAVFPQLIHRLILASTGNAVRRLLFRSDDSIQQQGWDGICDQDVCVEHPWLPLGLSGWELATQRIGLRGKADEDYKKRTTVPDVATTKTTFVFASLTRWPRGQNWASSKRDEGIWGDVRAIDADGLVQWIELYPCVGYWLAAHLGKITSGLLPLIDLWNEWRLATKWPISSELMLAGRDNEAIDLLKWLRGSPSTRAVQADSPDEAMAFAYAAIDLLPEPHRSYYLMRCLRASTAEAARLLGGSSSPLVIFMDSSEPGLASSLVQRGHHVFVAFGSSVGISELDTVLPRPQHETFENALEDMGLAKSQATQLTRDSVRSLAILRRLIPADSARIPEWAEQPKAQELVTALLVGAWDGEREGDRLALEHLSGQKYDAWESQCTLMTGFPDAPLRHAGTAWKIASPRDAWFRLARFIGRPELDRFASVAQNVLGAADPRFTVNPDERWLAGVRGQLPKHSPWLLAGLSETLLLLSMFGDQVVSVPRAARYADTVVGGLLLEADALRWYSLSRQLRTLAEAAPDVFLEAVEKSLRRDDAPIMALFQEDGGPLMGNANHTDLLWALETLAWSPQYLSRVTEILGRLAVRDPGGQWANRPKSSLRTMFLLWMPQTHATLVERLRVIDHLRKREPDAAWSLMIGLLPSGHDTMSPTPQPRWRDFSVSTHEDVTYKLISDGASALSERLIEDAGLNAERWAQLVDAVPNLSPAWRANAISKLVVVADAITDDSSRMVVWSALRKLLSHHRSYSDAQWALPQDELDELENVYKRFQPVDGVHQRSWLFTDHVALESGQRGDDWQARQEELLARRRTAISEILASEDNESVQRLINEAERPYLVGVAYAQCIIKSSEADAIMAQMLARGEAAAREFVSGLIALLYHRFGKAWQDGVLAKATKEEWEESRILQILLALPSEESTWKLADSLGAKLNTEYWKSAAFWPRDDDQHITYAVNQLIEVGRARAAVHAVAGTKTSLPSDLIVRMLRKAVEESWSGTKDHNEPVMLQWSVCKLLRCLDEDPEIPETEIAHLEWAYLPLLEHSERPPIVLHQLMSSDPAFFVQVLSAIFRARSESASDQGGVTEQAKAFASQAFRLMESWNVVPGRTTEGLDASTLMSWVKEAHRLAIQAERGAVGDVYIGRALSFSRVDDDGIWPEKSVRDVIDEMRNEHVENGIVSGVHNKRGPTSRGLHDGGAQERDLARQYRAWADAVKFEWPRTSALLERIASSFDADARYHDDHVELTDWTY